MKSQSGLTLLETVIAMLLLAVGMLAIIPGIVHLSDVSSSNELRSAAVQAVQQINERERRTDPAMMPNSGSSAAETVQVGDYAFQVVRHFCQDAAFCMGDARHITTEVSFDGQVIYSTQTVFTPLQ